MVESVWQDVRYAVRNLRRQPVFTLVALSILTAGIGLNTALFTLLKEAVFQPWSGIPEPSRAIRLYGRDPDIGGLAGLSHPEYRHLAAHARSVEGLAAWRNDTVRFADQSGSSTRITIATANFFQVLTRGTMARGRGFVPDDDARGAPRAVAVLSADYWRRELGGDPAIVGRTVRLDGVPFAIIGIAPEAFAGSEGSTTSVWIPMGALKLLRPNDPHVDGIEKPENCCSQIAGRLAPGVRAEQAESELALLSEQFRRSAGLTPRPLAVTPTSLIPAFERPAIVIGGAVMTAALLLVLMLACANVGNLLLARAAARVREIGVRLSLGATRRRVVRQLLTESLVLALAAGAAGLFAAMQAVPVVRRMIDLPSEAPLAGVDWAVLLYTFAIAGVACLAFGLAPAVHATRTELTDALKSDHLMTRTRLPLRSLLLGVQVAVSVIFLACAGLFVRGVQQSYTLDLGFAVDEVAIVEIDLPRDAYDTGRRSAFLRQVAAELRTPGGPPIGLASWEPLGGNVGGAPVRHPGQSDEQTLPSRTMGVSAEYFQVLRIPIVAGRNFAANETGHRPVLVNERFARMLWQGESAIGKRFLSRRKDPIEHEVIGVVKDVYTERVDRIEPMFYNIFGGALEPKLLARASDAQALARVSSVAAELDSRARVRVFPLSENFRDEIAVSRRTALMAGGLGSLALGLSTVGMFGVFAFVVQQRTREIGIRMALGARAADVVRLVLAGNAQPVIAGFVVGVAGAMGCARLLQHLLLGLSPFDPIAHIGVACLLAAAGVAASYVPVRRAMRVDPIESLRHD